MPENRSASKFQAIYHRAMDLLAYYGTRVLGVLRQHTDRTREQVQELFYSTSDQVLERAEETRKAVRLRMAILEIEHHLNRLYPQIGKLSCDLVEDGSTDLPAVEDWRAKVDLAGEYRQRLADLRQELDAHTERNKTRPEE